MQSRTLDGTHQIIVNGILMKILTPKVAMKRLDVTRVTFSRWVKNKTIKIIRLSGDNYHYFIAESEVDRVKKLMTRDWKRGKKKLGE